MSQVLMVLEMIMPTLAPFCAGSVWALDPQHQLAGRESTLTGHRQRILHSSKSRVATALELLDQVVPGVLRGTQIIGIQ
jgi:hypothetical protein